MKSICDGCKHVMKVKLYAEGVLRGGGFAGAKTLQLVEGLACKLAMIPLGPQISLIECTEFEARDFELSFKGSVAEEVLG